MRVAITGSLASGKSTVLGILKDMGFSVGSCDELVSQVLSTKVYVKRVLDLLGIGNPFLGVVELKKTIADIVFNDQKKMLAYLRFLYPIVESKMIYSERQHPDDVWFWEVPMLYESGWEDRFDKVLTVVVPDKTLREGRALQRGISAAEFQRRDALQLDVEGKARRADYVIENNGDIDDLKRQVSKFLLFLGLVKEEKNGRKV